MSRRRSQTVDGAPDEPGNNDWAAINQFTIIENKANRRPDILVFINGLPLGVIELKNIGDENATVRGAFNQINTYKADISSLFTHNEIVVISDGINAKAGTLTADWERYMPWRTVDGKDIAPKGSLQLDVVIKGIFEKNRFFRLGTQLRRFRRRRWATCKEDGGLSSVPRGEQSRGKYAPCCRLARRPTSWSRMAHAGQRQEPLNGLLCRQTDPASSAPRGCGQ